MARGFYLLAYDIADDKRRLKIAKACESVAERVQNSVFEAHLEAGELNQLVQRTKKIMKPEEDSLRIYLLCASCQSKISVHGQGRVTPPPGLVIV